MKAPRWLTPKVAAVGCAVLIAGGATLVAVGVGSSGGGPSHALASLGSTHPPVASALVRASGDAGPGRGAAPGQPAAAAAAVHHASASGRRASRSSTSGGGGPPAPRPATTADPGSTGDDGGGSTGGGGGTEAASGGAPPATHVASTTPVSSPSPPAGGSSDSSSPAHASDPPAPTYGGTPTGMSLRIPAIHVDAPVVSVGVAADHSIAVPPLDKPNLAAWYDGSVRPGEQGTAVILGHIDSAATGPSVFYHLSSLRPGDRVTVTVPKLGRVVYRVDGRREYHKTALPYAQVFGPVRYAALRLITCGGSFDDQTGHYVDNVVVYASLVSG